MLYKLPETKVVRVDGVERYIMERGTIVTTQGCTYLTVFVYSTPTNIEKPLVRWLEH